MSHSYDVPQLNVLDFLSDIDESKHLKNRIKSLHVIASLEDFNGEVLPVFHCSEPICMTEDAYEAFSESVVQSSLVHAATSGELSLEALSSIATKIIRKFVALNEVFFPDENIQSEVHELRSLDNIFAMEHGVVLEFESTQKKD